jgi:hypothetical protein
MQKNADYKAARKLMYVITLGEEEKTVTYDDLRAEMVKNPIYFLTAGVTIKVPFGVLIKRGSEIFDYLVVCPSHQFTDDEPHVHSLRVEGAPSQDLIEALKEENSSAIYDEEMHMSLLDQFEQKITEHEGEDKTGLKIEKGFLTASKEVFLVNMSTGNRLDLAAGSKISAEIVQGAWGAAYTSADADKVAAMVKAGKYKTPADELQSLFQMLDHIALMKKRFK